MTNFNHLVLLYEQMSNISKQVRNLIDKDDLDELANVLRTKDSVIEKILMFEKTIKFTPEQKEQQKKIKEEIAKSEKENIELLQLKQQELKKQIQGTTKNKKIVRAYMAQVPDVNSTIDIKE